MLAVAVAMVVGGATAVLVDTTPTAGSPAAVVQETPAAAAPVTGDYDGDGRDDLLWYGAGSAADHLWFGGSSRAFTGRRVTVGGAYFPLVGDFDGSGRSDVLWYAPGVATDYLWRGTANRTFVGRQITVSGTYSPVVGDFDGDGRHDVLWYSPGGRDTLWYGTAEGSFTARAVDVAGTFRPIVGDFDGSGTDDLVWYGAGADPDFLWRGRSDRTFAGVGLSVQGTFVPQVGDLDGNGRADILWHRDSGGGDVIWAGRSGGGFSGSSLSAPEGTSPFLGDFNGDGPDDVFWYAAGSVPDQLWLGRAGPAFAPVRVSVAGTYRPVVADFDGDRRHDVFWYAEGDPPDRLWFGAPGGTFVSVPTTLDLAPPPALPLRQETLDQQYDPYGLVAHAMGPTPPAADGRPLTYTNSLEAFEHNYGRGFRVFEVDFVRLADGAVLAAHDGTESAFGLPSGVRFASVTRNQVGTTFSSHGTEFTALYAEDVVDLLRTHPDMYVVLDSKTAHVDVYRAFHRFADGDPAIMERVLPHVAGQGHLDALRRIYPLRNYVLALYRTQVRNQFDDAEVVDFVRRNRTPAVMMWWDTRDFSLTLAANMREHRRYRPEFVDQLRAAGAIVYVHSLASAARIQEFQAKGIGVYSDGPFPPYTTSDGAPAAPPIDSNEPPA